MKLMERGAPVAPGCCKRSWNWGFAAGMAMCAATWGGVALAAWWRV